MRRHARCPVIFLSALEAEQDKVKAFEVGGADYVMKPIRAAEVMARINTHLALRRALNRATRPQRPAPEAIRVTLEERAQECSGATRAPYPKRVPREVEVNLKTVAALRRSERNYRRIIDTANEGIWMVDSDSKTVSVNSRMASMLGYEPKK